MWNPFRPKQADFISHWYAPVPNFQESTQEFYSAIEKEVAAQKVPGLEMSRVDFAEGGPLSAKRTYLRMTRERLIFDVCAAPFGTSYFFSLRFAELPTTVSLFHLLAVLFVFSALFVVMWTILGTMFGPFFGFLLGSFLFFVVVVSALWAARNAVAMGLQDLDATLLKIPIIGPVYDRFIRKQTYYRFDTRLMFWESISAIVKAKVDEVTSAKGIKLLTIKQHAPLLDDLYKPTLLGGVPSPRVNIEPPPLPPLSEASDEPTG